VYRLLVGRPAGKRPLGRPRRRWIDNIKMDLSEIGLSVADWIGLTQIRYRWRALVNALMNHSGSIKMLGTTEWLHNLWLLEWYSAPQISQVVTCDFSIINETSNRAAR
jgi:hypothetical protein